MAFVFSLSFLKCNLCLDGICIQVILKINFKKPKEISQGGLIHFYFGLIENITCQVVSDSLLEALSAYFTDSGCPGGCQEVVKKTFQLSDQVELHLQCQVTSIPPKVKFQDKLIGTNLEGTAGDFQEDAKYLLHISLEGTSVLCRRTWHR